MSICPLVVEDFVVVATLKGLVSEEVNFVKVLSLDVIQAVSLVPACGENVEAEDLGILGRGGGGVRKIQKKYGERYHREILTREHRQSSCDSPLIHSRSLT